MLFTILLALTVFGGAVTLVDLFTGLGTHNGDGDGGDDGEGHLMPLDHSSQDQTGVVKPDSTHFDGTRNLRDRAPGSSLYKVVSWLRRSVYFSLGAGVAGLGALVSGAGVIGAVLWSVATGAGALGILSMVRKFQSEDLDSTVSEEELLWEEGEVTVAIHPGQLGKIRLRGKGSLVERYARTRSEVLLGVGDRVVVVEIKENELLVEPGTRDDLPPAEQEKPRN